MYSSRRGMDRRASLMWLLQVWGRCEKESCPSVPSLTCPRPLLPTYARSTPRRHTTAHGSFPPFAADTCPHPHRRCPLQPCWPMTCLSMPFYPNVFAGPPSPPPSPPSPPPSPGSPPPPLLPLPSFPSSLPSIHPQFAPVLPAPPALPLTSSPPPPRYPARHRVARQATSTAASISRGCQ